MPPPVRRRFLVSVPHGGELEVEAFTPQEAIAIFRDQCGIRESAHAFDVVEL